MRERTRLEIGDALRRAIATGELPPGTRLSEKALAERFEISRTPVREALKQLESEGFVSIRARAGTTVTAISWPEVVEIARIKETLEGLAARQAAEDGMAEVIDEMARNVAASRRAIDRADVDRYVALAPDFHTLLIAASGNEKLGAVYRGVIGQYSYRRLAYSALHTPSRPSRSLDAHAEIVEAILARDGDRAEEVVRAHARTSRGALARSILAMHEDGANARSHLPPVGEAPDPAVLERLLADSPATGEQEVGYGWECESCSCATYELAATADDAERGD